MTGTSIRNIRRNQSEMFVGTRCNRYGDQKMRQPGQPPALSLKNYRQHIASGLAGIFKIAEYLKHRTHQKALIRAINRERG